MCGEKKPLNIAVIVAIGITPAHAGKRFQFVLRLHAPGDYPRVCGEKLSTTSTDIHPAGSPPRMRGKDTILNRVNPRPRITPACAGKRPGWADFGCQRGDHPRVCGEKLVEAGRISQEEGSPPRVRGKAAWRWLMVTFTGITPACAGKRTGRLQCKTSRKDHPRVCGEKCQSWAHSACRMGSPPHVRGKGQSGGRGLPGVGITPACAGKRAGFFLQH